MTTDREVMQMALDQLSFCRVFVTSREKIKHPEGTDQYDDCIEALRARLAQGEQEPYGYLVRRNWKEPRFIEAGNVEGVPNLPFNNPEYQPLYTAPLQRKPNPFDGRKLSDYDNGYLHGFDDAMESGATPPQREEKQEPVAWVDLDCWLHGEFWPDDCFSDEAQEGYTPLYTAPPQREWQGLTDEEIAEAMVFNKRLMAAHIEAKLKEKNT